jgi:iron complex transport system substrate-binding protein
MFNFDDGEYGGMTTPRIMSLLPSGTEIICALGLEAYLVGISHACDYPESITDRPRLTAPEIDLGGGSATMDSAVSALVQPGPSVYRIDTQQLQALTPNVIVTQDQCEVGPVSYAEVIAAVQASCGPHVEVVSLSPKLLQDIWADIRSVGRATGRLQEADVVLAACFERVHAIIAETIMIPEPPRVAAIAWLEPLMLGGYWIPELLQLAGGRDGLCQPGSPVSLADWEVIRAYDPEVLTIMPCGYPLEKTLSEVSTLTRLPGWDTLRAVREGRVYAVDGRAYFHRPGPRVVDSLELLAGCIHPDMFGEFLEDRHWAYRRID